MNPVFASASIILILSQVITPRKWSFAPILIAALHLPNHLITGNFTIVRALIITGIARAILTGSLKEFKANKLDFLFILTSIWIIASGTHHNPGYNPYIERLGFIINISGSYFFFRLILPDIETIKRLVRFLPIILVPFAILIAIEKTTGTNQYHITGTTKQAGTRDGEVRAQATFSHPILAGTIGACFIPLAFAIDIKKRKTRLTLYTAGATTAIASASSGPLAITALSFLLIYLYKKRDKIPIYKQVLAYILIVLHFVIMNRPVWYILADIDLTGGSTGWHRAHLINQSIEYINEWWLFGTDFTRHWMPTGVPFSPNHTDLTNYYIHLGVLCGLPCVIFLFYTINKSINFCIVQSQSNTSNEQESRIYYALGCYMAVHALSCISVSYFGKAYIFLYLGIAAISTLSSEKKEAQ